jgi:hypothetical protein
MDTNDISRLAPDIAKGAGALAAAIPFTAIAKRMLGPAADELAEMWRDQVRLYRYERQLKCVQKAERMAQEAGFTPQAVPPKILFPLLEGASFEENEDLHTMWAALLANAASPKDAGKVRPGFIALLTQMSPDEAAILNWIFGRRTGPNAGPFDAPISFEDLIVAHSLLGLQVDADPLHFQTCLQSLQAEQLIEPRPDVLTTLGRLAPSYSLTFRGLSFMYACRAPVPKPGNPE